MTQLIQALNQSLFRRGQLHVRLTVLIVVSAGLLLATSVTLIALRAQDQMESDAEQHLEMLNRTLTANTSTWLDLNIRALDQLGRLPGILSMDAAQQRPILEATHAAYPHMYLISTTDLNGLNVARSDDAELTDYADRTWFQSARDGVPLTFQTLIGRTSGEPALVVSMPLRSEDGTIIGVGMFASDLTDISVEVNASRIDDTGFAYIVDANNRVLAHPDSELTASLFDFSDDPAVVAARQGDLGAAEFTQDGEGWRSFASELDNGWIVVVRQQESELLGPLNSFRRIGLAVLTVGLVLLALLTWVVIRYALQPIGTLTEVATAVAQGDLTREVPVESQDELGTLAQAFNSMTGQLRQLIASLEDRVAARVRDLRVAVEVSRQISTILDPVELLPQVVELTKDRFGLYHAHVYLLGENPQVLVLAAGSGEAGRIMKERGHRIAINLEQSLVARAARTGQPVVVDNVSAVDDFLPNPLLPYTRSEAAFPVMMGNRLLGVLDVQSTEPGRFDEDIQTVMTSLASQIAVALDNAHLFSELERTSRHEQMMTIIAQEIQAATSMEEVLQVAARELGRALRVPHTLIELELSPASSGGGSATASPETRTEPA